MPPASLSSLDSLDSLSRGQACLHCPACGCEFVVDQPSSCVALTRCPAQDCQSVALVCSGPALPHATGIPTAVGLTEFTRARPRPPADRTTIITIFACVVAFLIGPVLLVGYAWPQRGSWLFVAVVMLAIPAAFVGVSALCAFVVQVLADRREHRRLRRVRTHAFTEAVWVPGRHRSCDASFEPEAQTSELAAAPPSPHS